MKKALLILTALVCAASAHAQGTITFFNGFISNPSGGGTYDALVTLPGGAGPGAGYTAAIFRSDNLVTQLLRPNGSPSAVGFFGDTGYFATTGDVIVPGANPGTSANLTVLVWDSTFASYQAQIAAGVGFAGEGSFASRPLGGPNPIQGEPGFTSPGMTGFQPITLSVVPEPSTLALGVLGLGALALRRRK